MSIVSNSSPLVSLSRIGQLDLLRQLYGEVYIPEAVWQEVVIRGAGQPGANEVRSAKWISVRPVNNRLLVHTLNQNLDEGESEAIVLALEIRAELLLMDERLGREVARHHGLRYTGVIGILIEAKNRNLISAVRPHLDALRNVAGFRISETLYLKVIQDITRES